MNKVAFIFSGYSKDLVFSKNMMLDYDNYKKNVLDTLISIGNNLECVNVLRESLKNAKNIEQCTLILNIALANYLIAKGIKPDYLLGFSAGNIHALNCADAISLDCAMETLNQWKDIINGDKFLKTSSMVLVERIDYSMTEVFISKYKGSCPISYNTNTSTTVLVQDKFKDDLCHDIKYAGGKTTSLNKTLFYSLPFMSIKNTKLFMFLNNYAYRRPQIATYVNSSLFNADRSSVASFCSSFTEPIIFNKQIENLANMGVKLFIEVGGNDLLSCDIEVLVPDANVYSVSDLKSAEYIEQKLLMHV